MESSGGRTQRGAWRTLAVIFVVAVGLNYVWELAQAPLYAGVGDFRSALLHCIAPSLGDGLLVLLIFAFGRVALRKWDWFARPGVSGYALMIIAGLAIAVGVELVAVHALGRWEYASRMPLVPWLGVGLAPVAQMLVLPPIVFRVVASWVAPPQ